MPKGSSSPPQFTAAMRIIVLHGKERFLIEEHTRSIVDALEAKFGGIEQFHFDGETTAPATVLDELRSYGLMQRHKLVVLDNADKFLAGPKGDEEDESKGGGGPGRKLLEKYSLNPVEDATLLMRAETWRPGNLDKMIIKQGGLVVQCESPSPASAAGWCVKRCLKRYEATLEPPAAEQLVARIGPHLQHLDIEMQKLAAAAGPGKTIDRKLVIEMVGLSKDEKAWEIQAAILTGDPAAMLGKLRELIDISRHDVVPLNWSVIDLLRKLHAASHLVRRGVPFGSISSQLKLWPNPEPIIAIASELKPARLAQLLQHAVDTDRSAKSGLGDPVRNLEALLVKIADTLQSIKQTA